MKYQFVEYKNAALNDPTVVDTSADDDATWAKESDYVTKCFGQRIPARFEKKESERVSRARRLTNLGHGQLGKFERRVVRAGIPGPLTVYRWRNSEGGPAVLPLFYTVLAQAGGQVVSENINMLR